MKYLFVINQFMMGGTEKVFLNIVSNIDVEVYLLPIHRNYNEELLAQLPNHVTILHNEVYKLNRKIFSLFYLVQLARYVNTVLFEDSNNLCCINFSDTISTIIVTLLIKAKRYISWCHCNPYAYKKTKFFFIYRILFKRFDEIINLCQSQKDAFAEVFGKNFKIKNKICFNFIDLVYIDAQKNDVLHFVENYILSVARFDNRTKDFYTLIDAYAKLNNSLKCKFKLVLVGDGPDITKIRAYVFDKKIHKYVYFMGLQVNPYKWMANSALFVLSSSSEGFSMVISEALACNCPVIASDCIAGPRDILENGKYGYLFKVGDTEQLYTLLLKLLSDKSLSATLRLAARERVETMNERALIALKTIIY